MAPGALRRAAACFALCLLGAPGASADERQECVDASESAQRLRKDGHYLAAAERLAVCSRASCPGVVQRDCTTWLGELMSITPSIVVGAKDDQGIDVVDVRVSVDGKLVAPSLDGREIPVDPGPREVKCEANGFQPFSQRMLLREGEKRRVFLVTLTRLTTASKPPPVVHPSGDTGGNSSGPDRPWVPLALAGVGLAGVIAGTSFYLVGSGNISDAEKECPQHDACPPVGGGSPIVDYVRVRETGDSGRKQATAGIVIGSIGAVFLAAGLIWHFSWSPGARAALVPAVGAGHAGLAAAGAF